MIITVKILRGPECTIEASGATSVGFVKQVVARELDIPADQQRLVFRGKTLSDGQCLGDYDIVEGSRLHLVVRKADSEDDEPKLQQHSFWLAMERTLAKHFTKEDTVKVLQQLKKELVNTIQKSSLDDIDRFAQDLLRRGSSCVASSSSN